MARRKEDMVQVEGQGGWQPWWKEEEAEGLWAMLGGAQMVVCRGG